jgi:hypothetical protein
MPATTTGISVLEHPLIRRLIQLDLDRDNFVIFGSGPLLAHGIRRNIHDLDVVARGSAWHRVFDQGIPSSGKISGAPATCFWGGRIQFFREWISTDWDSNDLIDHAEIIEGLRFARLADVLSYKRMLMRPKDIMDIHAITKFIYGRLGKYRPGDTADEDDLWATRGYSPRRRHADRVGSLVELTVRWQTDPHRRRTSRRGAKTARQHGRAEMSPVGNRVAAAGVWSVGHAVAEPTVAEKPSWSP